MQSSRIVDPSTSAGYDLCVKAILIGDSSVGKSSLLFRYSDADWNPHYIATIGVDFRVLTFEKREHVVKLQLWDSAGQERFRGITHSYYRGCHGVMLVFDVTNRQSFENVATWMQDVKRYGSETCPIVLIGNKCDCLPSKREVEDAEAAALAAELGCKYLATSAKTGSGVDEAFEVLVDDCITQRLKIMDKKTTKDPLQPDRRRPVALDKTDGSKSGSKKLCPCS